MNERSVVPAPGVSWSEILHRDAVGFAAAFDTAAVLHASVLEESVVGAEQIFRFFETTKAMYDDIAFTHEHRCDDRTVLEWSGHFAGSEVSGVTLLVYSHRRRIREIRLLHQPLDQVNRFARELAGRLKSEAIPEPTPTTMEES